MTNLSIVLDNETERTLKYFGFIDDSGRVNKDIKFSPYVCNLIRVDLLNDMELGKAKKEWIRKGIENLKREIVLWKAQIDEMFELLRKNGKL